MNLTFHRNSIKTPLSFTGLDLAHPMNGYRYHTKYDHIDYIPQPCLQRTGDNVLGLVRSIANSEQLSDIKVELIAEALLSLFYECIKVLKFAGSRKRNQHLL